MIRKIAFVLLLCAAGFVGWWNYSIDPLGLAREVRNAAGTFRLARPLPVIRTESGGTVWNDRFYIVGGIDSWARTMTSFMEYDRSADRWRALPDLPEKINHAGVVAHDGKIYVVGGFGPLGIRLRGFMFARWRPLDTLYIFDIRQGRWTQGPAMPEPRGAGGVTVADGAIWYVGGIDQALSISDSLFRFDLTAGTWQKMSPMPTPRDHLRMEAVGPALYAISGRKDDLRHNLSVVERYDIPSGRWTRVADIPNGRGGMGSAVKDGLIYVFGGEHVWDCFDEIDRYDPVHDRWDVPGRLPEARHGIMAGLMSDGIHLVSGGRHPRVSASGIHRVYEPSALRST